MQAGIVARRSIACNWAWLGHAPSHAVEKSACLW
jgi:hypothetical protein